MPLLDPQRRRTLLSLTILIGSASVANAQFHTHDEQTPVAVDFRVSCSTPVQARFDRAVAMLHHMTYPEARAVFEQVAKIDPRCAMAHWGIAMTLFQPLWPTRPSPQELQQGWREVQTAESLSPTTDRERLLVQAVAAFFRKPASTDYWLRIRRWQQAMERAYAAFPRDADVAALSALALLAVVPSDTVSRAPADSAATRLLAVLERIPEHPGAMHYLVHANDMPGRERESPNVLRQYEATAPDNPHALHMPTHVYVRLGDWDAVIGGNERAAEAALRFPAGDHGQFVWDEFPHAIEYLIYALLQRGDDEAAARQLQRLIDTPRLQPSFKTAFHLASTRARYAVERHAWREAMALAPREPASLDWDRFAWPEAVTWFAKGLGAAHEGSLEEARAAAARLQLLESNANAAGEPLFARSIRILRLEVDAWLAHAEGAAGSSVALMREAAALEMATPKHSVTPAPTLPAEELLGDLLLEAGQHAEALAAYRRALSQYPRRFNSLLGAARAARATGEDAVARAYRQELLGLAPGATRLSALEMASGAPVADHHQHLFSPATAAMIAAANAAPQVVTARDVVALLDSAGIRRAVVLSVAYMYGSPSRKVEDEYAKVRADNDWIADQAAQFPERLLAFCGFNPLKDYALEELERCARHPRLRKGIKLHFGNADVQLDDPAHLAQLKRVFRAANEHGMAIVVHLRASISRKRPYGAAQARIFLEQLLPLVPDVTVQVAHLAGTGPGYDDPPADSAMAVLAAAVEQRDPRTDRLWFDVASVVDRDISPANAALVVRRIRQVGVGRILYGTDAALGDNLRPRESWAAFRRLPLTKEEFQRIAGNVAPYLR